MLGLMMAMVWVTAAAQARRPNVLLLLVDDLGYGDLGCYGNTTLETPNIDGLARDGARLTQALAAAATCTPSRAALLTARYPARMGLAGSSRGREVLLFTAQSGGLPQTEVTLARVLLEEGYNTSLVGKWHLGVSCSRYGDNCHTPNSHGFQHWYGLPLTNLKDFGEDGCSVVNSQMPSFFSRLYAVLAGSCVAVLLFFRRSTLLCAFFLLVAVVTSLLLLFVSNITIINSQLMRDGQVVEQPVRLVGLTQRFVSETKELLDAYHKENRLFFHVLSFSKVHTHLSTQREFVGRSAHGLYGDSVMELDWAVGEVLQHLQRRHLAEHTLVLLTSDNGGHLEERGVLGDRQGGHNGLLRGGKLMGSMDGGIRVPTIVRYPGRVPAGLQVSAPVSLMDLFPTVLSLISVNTESLLEDRTLDGRDISALLTANSEVSPHRHLFHYCGPQIHAVRLMQDVNTTWKVHLYWPAWLKDLERCEFACLCSDAEQLSEPRVYNVQQDPTERHQLPPGQLHEQLVLAARRAVVEHQRTVQPVPDQYSWSRFVWNPLLQPCCNPPQCHCTDPKYPGPYY